MVVPIPCIQKSSGSQNEQTKFTFFYFTWTKSIVRECLKLASSLISSFSRMSWSKIIYYDNGLSLIHSFILSFGLSFCFFVLSFLSSSFHLFLPFLIHSKQILIAVVLPDVLAFAKSLKTHVRAPQVWRIKGTKTQCPYASPLCL